MSVRNLRVTAVAGLVFLLQVALVAKSRVFGIHPDLLLLFSLCVGITGGRNRGAVAGFAAGLAADVFLTSPLGLSALAYTVAGYTVGVLAEDSSGLPWVTSLVAMAGTSIALVLFVVAGEFAGVIHVSLRHFIVILLVELVGTAVFAPVIAWILKNAWRERDIAW